MNLVIRLSISEEVTLDEIANRAGIAEESKVRLVLESKIHEHYALYGHEPYEIRFNRKRKGYVVKANSTIGLVDCGEFILEIRPKHSNLSIGKCLQLAHRAQATDLVNHNSSISEQIVDENNELVGLDYFAMAFASAIQDCVNSGLITTHREDRIVDKSFNGKLDIQGHVSSGGNRLDINQVRSSRSINNVVNGILVFTLSTCIDKSASDDVRAVCQRLLFEFKGVLAIEYDESDFDIDSITSLPRPDYERALTLARIITGGFSVSEGGNPSFLPFFTLNLDYLFERYCHYELKQIVNENKYTVEDQVERVHPFAPKLRAKKVMPDIVVYNKDAKKGRCVVLDSKNKFSIGESEQLIISNQDIFQVHYYSMVFDTNVAILLYPSDKSSRSKYPLKSAESDEKYLLKKLKHVENMKTTGKDIFITTNRGGNFYLIVWRVDLSGNLKNTMSSVAELSQLVADISNYKILE